MRLSRILLAVAFVTLAASQVDLNAVIAESPTCSVGVQFILTIRGHLADICSFRRNALLLY
jgi:hypothetical protein